MRRAWILVIGLSVLCFGCGFWADGVQHRTAQRYLMELEEVRRLVEQERWQQAEHAQHALFERWQQDQRWMNLLISHHHTRQLSGALVELSTAIARRWMDEALPAADEAQEALREISTAHLPIVENVI